GFRCQPRGVADARVAVAARRAVADRDVAVAIHGDAAHPAEERVRGGGAKRPLLRDSRRAVQAAELVPAHTDEACRLLAWPTAAADRHRVVDHPALLAAEVAIGQPVHQAVGERVELLARLTLRDAGATTAGGRAEGGHGDVRRAGE